MSRARCAFQLFFSQSFVDLGARVYRTLKSCIELLIFVPLCNCVTHQSIARELSKPLRDSASLAACKGQKFFGFVLLLFVGNVINGVLFGQFGSSYFALRSTARWKYFAQDFIGN